MVSKTTSPVAPPQHSAFNPKSNRTGFMARLLGCLYLIAGLAALLTGLINHNMMPLATPFWALGIPGGALMLHRKTVPYGALLIFVLLMIVWFNGDQPDLRDGFIERLLLVVLVVVTLLALWSNGKGKVLGKGFLFF